MMKTKTNWRYFAPLVILTTLLCNAAFAEVTPINSFKADYLVYRSGKKHGEAHRYLKPVENGYQLGYSSNISWMVFSDKRAETSDFTINNGILQPLRYIMQRNGTGPSRYYELNLDPNKKSISEGKDKKIKDVPWQEDWLDQISYQIQLVLDLRAGKTEFFYNVLNRHGDSKIYHYKVVAEELLALPYGHINTLRIARIEEKSDKQVYAWVAPELDYMLVRLWRGEDNVEQFDVQLHKLEMVKTDTTTPSL